MKALSPSREIGLKNIFDLKDTKSVSLEHKREKLQTLILLLSTLIMIFGYIPFIFFGVPLLFVWAWQWYAEILNLGLISYPVALIFNMFLLAGKDLARSAFNKMKVKDSSKKREPKKIKDIYLPMWKKIVLNTFAIAILFSAAWIGTFFI